MPARQTESLEQPSLGHHSSFIREFTTALHELREFRPDTEDPRYTRRGWPRKFRSFLLYSWVLVVAYFAGSAMNFVILALQHGVGAALNLSSINQMFLLGQLLQTPVLGAVLFVILLIVSLAGLLAYFDLTHERQVLLVRAKAMARDTLIETLNDQLAATRREIAAREVELAGQAHRKSDQVIDVRNIDSAGELASQVQIRTAKATENLAALSDDERKKIGGYVLNETLLIALGSPKPRTRRAVVEYIAKLGDLAPAEPIIVSLGDPDREVREAAQRTITLIPPDRILLPLEAALETSDVEGRKAALWALGQLGPRIPINAIVHALKDSEQEIRIEALAILGTTSDRTPVEPLVEMLHDDHWEVRMAVIETLATMADRTPVEPLVEMLHDDHWEVREAAVRALGRFKDQTPIELITDALEDDNPDVRRSARWVLWSLGVESSSNDVEEDE